MAIKIAGSALTSGVGRVSGNTWFVFKMAIKIAGSALTSGVGRVSGNTWLF